MRKSLEYLLVGCLLTGAIGYLDYVTGDEFSLELFYFFPIIYAGWKGGVIAAGPLIALTTATWIAADVATGLFFSRPYLYIWDGIVRVGVLSVVAFLVIKIRTILEREKKLARMDFLTDIPNSRAFYETAREEVERCRRFGHPLTLVYLDCDNFKMVNDHFGHQTGDLLLTVVAETLSRNIRSFDAIARLGGDEFAALLPETDTASARGMVDRIRLQLHEAMQTHGWGVTFSVGVASFAFPPRSVDEMVGRADDLMYEVKLGGKNTVKFQVFGNMPLETYQEAVAN